MPPAGVTVPLPTTLMVRLQVAAVMKFATTLRLVSMVMESGLAVEV